MQLHKGKPAKKFQSIPSIINAVTALKNSVIDEIKQTYRNVLSNSNYSLLLQHLYHIVRHVLNMIDIITKTNKVMNKIFCTLKGGGHEKSYILTFIMDLDFCEKKHFENVLRPALYFLSGCRHLWAEHNVMSSKIERL